MPTVDFLPFCTGSTSNLMDQATYAASSVRADGNPPGLAGRLVANKAWRQGTLMASALAQAIANITGSDVLDSGDPNALAALIQAMLTVNDPLGVVKAFWGPTSAIPPNHLIADGGTIGDGSSGSSNLANAACFPLFSHIWTHFTDGQYPLLTSSGGAATRGASAAADFGAHYRITLLQPEGEFLRYADLTRGLDPDYPRAPGSMQVDALQQHDIRTYPNNGGSTAAIATNSDRDVTSHIDIDAIVTGTGGTLRTSTETRAHNIALVGILRYA